MGQVQRLQGKGWVRAVASTAHPNANRKTKSKPRRLMSLTPLGTGSGPDRVDPPHTDSADPVPSCPPGREGPGRDPELTLRRIRKVLLPPLSFTLSRPYLGGSQP